MPTTSSRSSSRVSLPGVTIETTVETPRICQQTNRFCAGILYIINAIVSCLCFWVFFFLVLFCCLPCICICGIPNFGQRPNLDEAMLAALADVESRRQREEEEVKSHLFSQKVENAMAAARIVQFMNSPEKNTNGNVLLDSWNSAMSSVRSLRTKPTCAVCLEEYDAGDVLSWSKRDECTHVFHEECIVRWLTLHDDCPLCRCVIISDDENVAGGGAAADVVLGADVENQDLRLDISDLEQIGTVNLDGNSREDSEDDDEDGANESASLTGSIQSDSDLGGSSRIQQPGAFSRNDRMTSV